jgi:hypothetical protein
VLEDCLSRVVSGELFNFELVDNYLKIPSGLAEDSHALLSLECASGDQPSAQQLQVGLQLSVWVIATPSWRDVMNNPLGRRI